MPDQWKAVDESAWKLVDEPPPSKYQPIYDQLKSGDPRGVEAAKRLTPAEQQEFFDFQKNANKPNLHDRPDANILGVDQAGIANDASRLPESLRGPAAFGGSLVGSALEAFSAPESVATLGIGRIPNMTPNYTKVPFRETIKGLGRMIEQSPVGGVKTKVLGKVLQQMPSKQAAGIERYAPSTSGYEPPVPSAPVIPASAAGRGFDPANPPVFDPRIGGIMEGEAAPVGSHVTHPTPSVQPNMSRGATTPQVLPESWGKLTDAFTGTNAQLNAKLVKARILMKTQPELSLEQAMKAVAKQ